MFLTLTLIRIRMPNEERGGINQNIDRTKEEVPVYFQFYDLFQRLHKDEVWDRRVRPKKVHQSNDRRL